MEEKQEFEKYLQKTLREIKSMYVKFVGPRDEIYLTMDIHKEIGDNNIHISYNNDYWELPSSQKLRYWGHTK